MEPWTPDPMAPQISAAAPPPPVRRKRSVKEWLLSGLAVIYKAKVFLLFFSMVVSMLIYGWAFGWAFGVGLVILIAIHESGHVLANRSRGIEASWPTFIPFFGAIINLRQSPANADDEAFIGIAGPVFGLAASILSYGLYLLTAQPLFAMLALFGMLMHIFNLVPVVPLDGGRTVSFLGWKAWIPGLIGLAVILFYNPLTNSLSLDPVTLIILAFIVWNFTRRVRHGVPAAYNDIPLSHKWFYGLLWLFLMALSIAGYLYIGAVTHLSL
ncbi:MAG: hypothetical protein C7B46_09670 [Sulfobacillus benefaciens]|uniref:Peptidase M50 domain-containing protein n=1 Tax=Sulfobacillus benefaciens TaxID=453960 RepID=A0A2T2XGE7_9FIRM|nr:MAG: hypothetical protein C7B46_09670 [Sulfobacillus benefaciens]